MLELYSGDYMSKYYAVKIGRNPGIYNTWEDCKKEVEGFSGAVYKSFTTLQQAQDFLQISKDSVEGEYALIAYVDGSYNLKTHEYGYGCVLIESGQVIDRFFGKGDNETYASMRNVAGEILGSICAMKYARDHHYEHLCIYYDYEGIEKWADGLWKANKEGTQNYVRTVQQIREDVKISFVKVLAHSGDYYNEEADALAKRAVGIKHEK